ncbi:major facilitator superfamily domain-containing protein [Dioszegia hungarica]|uniref:Major facilitator superfamily domain-containing protein n=1 Tax=Dioszegia hungarica TaxID=4972 RepID=A0AA38LT73_9TREE|nr:major facilitator superfamily domain-containing protein [Dioszegia hungarica]KAI9634393.1 major facilitator superfamily domain-containing protein [Dioszegia hungarica]
MNHSDNLDGEKTGGTSARSLPIDNAEYDAVVPLDPKVEKKLLRRIDGFTISILGALYLMSFLDRGNIGAANVATPSISQATGLSPEQYGAVVSVVYATYVVCEPIWANLLKILSPKIVLSGTTLVWGGLTLGTAWAKNYQHLMAIRVLLGVFEAGVFPCITVYVLMNYRREEAGRRMSYIFSCAAFAGAVGGLIGFGLVRIETGDTVGWQYLYIVEGCLSLILAPIAYFWVPNRMDKAWFLNAKQREQAMVRYQVNKADYNEEEQFAWAEVKKALLAWPVYAAGTIQFCADITLYGISTFMPQIIRAMGFSNVNAQLLTVPVYVWGASVFMFVAWFSDKYRMRSPFIVLGLSLNLLGYILLATIESVAGRYTALYVISAGIYITPGLNVTWIGGNTRGHFKRSTAVGLNQLIGNSAGAAIGTIYLSTLAPRYLQSMYISMGLTAVGIVTAVVLGLHFKRQNGIKRQLVAEGAPDQPELGDHNPHFQYMI